MMKTTNEVKGFRTAGKDLLSREAVEAMLNRLGGCDASDEWAQGWDAAIDTAFDELQELPAEPLWKRTLSLRRMVRGGQENDED